MALPERVTALEKEIGDALKNLKAKVEEFEEVKALMDTVAQTMRTGKVKK